jgi:hypothetical protein
MSIMRKMRSLVKTYSGDRTYKKRNFPSTEEITLGMHKDVNQFILNSLQSYMIASSPGILLDIYFNMETQELKKLSAAIAEEHYNITDGADGNLNYLWYMYHKGTKKDDFRPFVYMAELMLLKKFGYLTEIEIRNLIGMMKSDDRDNLTMVTLTIENLRNLRIKDHGIFNKENKAYNELKHTYAFEVLNHTVFMQTMAEK